MCVYGGGVMLGQQVGSGEYVLGWVNLYQKFKIQKYTVCGKLILPRKMERHFKKNILAQLASKFACIFYEYLQASCIQNF